MRVLMIDRLLRAFKRLLDRKIASALDPLITSAAMFLVQGAVLVSASKLEFAIYSIAYSYVVMGQAVLSALFGGPLVTLLGKLSGRTARAQTAEAVLRFQLATSVMLGAFGAISAILFDIKAVVVILVVLSLIGLSFRDALRSVLAAEGEFTTALIIAIRFAIAITLVLGGVFLLFHRVDSILGLAAVAFGSLFTVVHPIATGLAARAKFSEGALRNLLGMAVWSVPGAIVIWLQNSFYLTLVAVNLSLAEAGEVSAARMVAMPLIITASGLLRLAQVQAGQQLAEAGLNCAIESTRRSALLFLAGGSLVAGLCWAGGWLIDRHWLPNAFPHLLELAGAWIAFAAAMTARGFYSALFQAMGRYREIFALNILVLPVVLGGVVIGPFIIGLLGAVLPMILGEILLLISMSLRAKKISF